MYVNGIGLRAIERVKRIVGKTCRFSLAGYSTIRHYPRGNHRSFPVLFQIHRDAVVFLSLVTSLPEVSKCSSSQLILLLIQQRQTFGSRLTQLSFLNTTSGIQWFS